MRAKHMLAAAGVLGAITLTAGELPQRQWTRIHGPATQGCFLSTTAKGEVYVAGSTDAQLEGVATAGGLSPFLAKYNSSGDVIWRRTWGSARLDMGNGVATDASGFAYVTGQTSGAFDGQRRVGKMSAFLTKWDAAGLAQWTRIWGLGKHTVGRGVCADAAGNVFVSGSADGRVFLACYTPSGSNVWHHAWPLRGDGSSVCTDADGNAYVSGATSDSVAGQTNPGGFSAFLTKVDATGSSVWTRIWGSPVYDWGNRVTVDSATNLYVVGTSLGTFEGQSNAGGYGAFLTKFDGTGRSVWTRMFGSDRNDSGSDVTIDAEGAIYVSGVTYGSFAGEHNAFASSAFLGKFDAEGNAHWTTLCGPVAADIADTAAGVDGTGNIFLAGLTERAFDGETNSPAGGCFLIKWTSPSLVVISASAPGLAARTVPP